MTQIAKKYIFRYTLQELFLIPLQFIINIKMAKVLKAYLLIIWNININLYSVKKNLRNCSHPNSVISKGYKGAGCWTELWKSILQPLKSIFSHTLFDRFSWACLKTFRVNTRPRLPSSHSFLYLSFRQFDKSSEEFVLCQMLAFGINNERAGPIIGYSRASSCLSSNWDYDFSIVAQHSSKFVTIVLVEGVI